MNGKMDLVQAEALSDVVNAESEEQSKLALAQLSGQHSAVYASLKERIVKMLAAGKKKNPFCP